MQKEELFVLYHFVVFFLKNGKLKQNDILTNNNFYIYEELNLRISLSFCTFH